MDILVFQLLRKVLPAHVRIDLEEFEPAPPLVQFDDPMPDAPIYDKPVWSIDYIALPPFWDYYGSVREFPLPKEWRGKTS